MEQAYGSAHAVGNAQFVAAGQGGGAGTAPRAMLYVVTARSDALKALQRATAARKKAQDALDRATRAEDAAIQDAADAGIGGTELSIETRWSREHIRKVIDPKFQRGRYAAADAH